MFLCDLQKDKISLKLDKNLIKSSIFDLLQTLGAEKGQHCKIFGSLSEMFQFSPAPKNLVKMMSSICIIVSKIVSTLLIESTLEDSV